ncbi:hypothetical protein HG535_0D03530 [Zygotorulaspora mrakii]|uniref:Uncharacterized protein n=1 Tax=Zygotorulaspora mrakii TaxID=42260 RepID=A0A7H9B1W1_ZYGMR|nr:uncharacterized protein HG535_0D03530 [Zygotorulaspora mrakii]QLG72645.1 hypothetical protein HG535_0D03530 [Zygotorulaspora mrakii]
MGKEFSNEMFSLNIFERAVQDPCCDGCDHEDGRCYERSEHGDGDEEHDPLEERSGGGGTKCVRNALVRHQSSPAMQTSQPARRRANSATLIRQISRQSTLDVVAPAGMSIEEGQPMEFVPQRQQQQQQQTPSPTPTQQQTPSPTPTLQRTRSSCACIPTHLYGLEKYVSSVLDALSTGDYQDVPESLTAAESAVSSPLSSQSSSFSKPQCDSRKKSFIETSLAKSFSQ